MTKTLYELIEEYNTLVNEYVNDPKDTVVKNKLRKCENDLYDYIKNLALRMNIYELVLKIGDTVKEIDNINLITVNKVFDILANVLKDKIVSLVNDHRQFVVHGLTAGNRLSVPDDLNFSL